MSEAIVITGRQCGRTHRARIEAAVRQHQAAIDKHRDTLHPEDLEFEPRNFADWVNACESYPTAEKIEFLIRHLTPAIESARRSSSTDARAARLIDMRTPYLEYAQQALARRFGIHVARSRAGGDA